MKRKKAGLIIGIILAIILIALLCMAAFLMAGQKKIKNTDIQNISVQNMPDGVYRGSFSGYRWSNTLDVTISGGKIVDIKVVKDVKVPVSDVTDKLFNSIKEKQNIDVDAISGATVTCKAYQKAIENALKNNT
ncbi:MAG: FMN-binding protein [Bacillota bacterium]|nr:FMN-binding protein [Bacillota bacterium]